MDVAYFLLIFSLISLGSATVHLKIENEDEKFPYHFCVNQSVSGEKCFDGTFSHKECKKISMQVDLHVVNTTVRLVSSDRTFSSLPINDAHNLSKYANQIFCRRSVPPLIFLKVFEENESRDRIIVGEQVIFKTSPLEADAYKAIPTGVDMTCGQLTEINVNIPNDAEDVNQIYERHTALFWAIYFGDFGTVKTLFNQGADTLKLGTGYLPALHVAARSCNEEIMKFLLDHGVIAPTLFFLPTPLMVAVEAGNINNVRLLLKNTSVEEINSSSLLYGVSRSGDNPDIVDLLITSGADVTRKIRDGLNALHVAAFYGRPKNIKKLVERGAPVDVKDNNGRTPLMAAAEAGQTQCVEELIALGANVKAVDSRGKSVLEYAQNNPVIKDIINSKVAK